MAAMIGIFMFFLSCGITRLSKPGTKLPASPTAPSLPYPGNLKALQSSPSTLTHNSGVYFNSEDAPEHLRHLFADTKTVRVLLREWEDLEWRKRSGWLGTDLIHDAHGKGVVVHCYFYDKATQTLTGIASFGPAAESHRGLCHGGAMTSLFDDLAGHIVFIDKGEAPWDGATVNVTCDLLSPVPVGSIFTIKGRVTNRERKKVSMTAELIGEDGKVYAKMHGLSIQPVVMGKQDAVGLRRWKTVGSVMCDSGWELP
jgi:acyl-coenzyme A thioesterase PaaI-like protein